MLHSTQHDSAVVYMAIIALALFLFIGLLVSLGTGFLGLFGLKVVAFVATVIFIVLFVRAWVKP